MTKTHRPPSRVVPPKPPSQSLSAPSIQKKVNMLKRLITLEVDSDGLVMENGYYYGQIQMDENYRVTHQNVSYPTYVAFKADKTYLGRYRESRFAIFAVVLGYILPPSLPGA